MISFFGITNFKMQDDGLQVYSLQLLIDEEKLAVNSNISHIVNRIAEILASQFVRNKVCYQFEPLSWFDRKVILGTKDVCVALKCMLSFLLCFRYNLLYAMLMGRYSVKDHELFHKTQGTYYDHWRYLKMWDRDGIMKTLGYYRNLTITNNSHILVDNSVGVEKELYNMLGKYMTDIQDIVYYLLKYQYQVLGKVSGEIPSRPVLRAYY